MPRYQTPDFEATRTMMRGLGLVEEEARSHPEVFGSWFIAATGDNGRVRVVWEGREGWLFIQSPSPILKTEWDDRWVAGEGHPRKIADLRDGLVSVLKIKE